MKRNATLLAVLCLITVAFIGVAAQTAKPFDITGKWNSTINTPDKTIAEVWDLTHDGNKLMGTVKNASGTHVLSGTIEGNTVRGLVREGTVESGGSMVNHLINLIVDGEELDGTIRMGKNVFLLRLRRAK